MLRALSVPSSVTTLRVNKTRTDCEEVKQKLIEQFTHDGICAYDIEAHPNVQGVITLRAKHPHNALPALPSELEKEVLISRKTGEAVLCGADVFVPGVLATSAGLEKEDSVIVSIYIGKETVTRGSVLTAQMAAHDKFKIGIGVCQLSRRELFREMHGLAVKVTESISQSPPCNGVLVGDVMLQNLPSIVAALVVEPQPGWHVLDMCAAPGGKTTALAELMQDQGEIIALDRTNKKAASILSLAEELGLSCITVYKMDATKSLVKGEEDSKGKETSCEILSEKELARRKRKAATRLRCKQETLPTSIPFPKSQGFAAESFDAVLLDAPCSALGLRPRLQFPQTIHDLEETAQYQRRLLDTAVHLVKPDGTLVYSTCTINPGENEANVRYVLDTYPVLQLVEQQPYVGSTGLVSDCWLTSSEAPLVQRFFPDAPLDTIGFFIAKFRKHGHIKFK